MSLWLPLKEEVGRTNHDVFGNVTATRLEESKLAADVGTRDETWAADESSTNVGNNGAVTERNGR